MELNWALISNYITWVFCSAQVILLVFAYTRYLHPLSKRAGQLRNELDVLSAFSTAQMDDAKKRRELEESLFRNIAWGRQHFRAYVASWRDARLHGDERAACCVRLRDFLTPQVVIHEASNQRSADAFPGFFLAGGIFGTFLGIVLGLAGVNLNHTTVPSALLDGVRSIVAGMQLAFITSLIGIFSSVLFSWLHRKKLRELEYRVTDLDAAASKVFPCLSEENYERQFLENLIGVKTQMQTLATDIALKMSSQMGSILETAVTSQLAPILGDIKITLDRFIRDTDEKSIKAVDDMLNKYVNMLSGTFSGQIDSLTAMIKETGEAQSDIKKALTEYCNTLKAQYEVQEKLVDRTTRAVEYLDDSMEGLSSCASDMKKSAADLRASADLFSQTASSLEGIKDLHEKLDGVIKTMTHDLNSLLGYIDGLLERMAEALGSQLTTALNSFDDKLAEVLSRFSGTLAETRDTINELPSLLGDLAGGIDKITTILDEQKDNFEKIRLATGEILERDLKQVTEAAATASTAAAGIQNSVVSLDKWLNSFEQIAKTSLYRGGDGDKRIDTAGQNEAGATISAASITKDIMESLEKSSGSMTTQLKELRREILEGALQKMYMTQGQALDTSREIRAVLKNIETAAGSISKGLAELRGPESREGKRGGLGGLFGR